jgi:CHAT domain-containing protein
VLVLPIDSKLKGVTDLCIIPDGVLWQIPFAALRRRDNRFLIERFSIHYAPSLMALKTILERKSTRRSTAGLLAMAPFAGSSANALEVERSVPLRGTYGVLPHSGSEAMEIASYGGTRAYLRNEATESKIKADGGKYRVLHLATHGLYDTANPMYSSVLLAPGGGEDGYWEAREIVDEQLNADLVVLSACDTARGQVRSGEGTIGLSWALLAAGAGATLLSQWSVNDESTERLMTGFYKKAGLLRKNATTPQNRASALRFAQLRLLKSKYTNHPYYWAAFVFVGDWM